MFLKCLSNFACACEYALELRGSLIFLMGVGEWEWARRSEEKEKIPTVNTELNSKIFSHLELLWKHFKKSGIYKSMTTHTHVSKNIFLEAHSI